MSKKITINQSSAIVAGSCNACGRTTQEFGNYAVNEVSLSQITFRICQVCTLTLASLLRGEPPPVNRGEQLDRVAKMMAASYWRGRLHGIAEVGVTEAMISAAANAELDRWRSSAHYAITGNTIPK